MIWRPLPSAPTGSSRPGTACNSEPRVRTLQALPLHQKHAPALRVSRDSRPMPASRTHARRTQLRGPNCVHVGQARPSQQPTLLRPTSRHPRVVWRQVPAGSTLSRAMLRLLGDTPRVHRGMTRREGKARPSLERSQRQPVSTLLRRVASRHLHRCMLRRSLRDQRPVGHSRQRPRRRPMARHQAAALPA